MKLNGLSKQVLLVICDGMGYSKNTFKNAVKDAKTPNLDRIYKNYPFTTIWPGGEYVGLPDGVAGNSEVGHMNLGAGRPVRQDLVRINEAIANNTLATKEELQNFIRTAKEHSKRVHLMGLLSDGGVHSHIEHLFALADIFQNEKLEIFLHAFMDGRDTAKNIGHTYINRVLEKKHIRFASIQGRSIGMDRDRRWEKTQIAYNTLIGQGEHTSLSPMEYVQQQYSQEIFDEFITPVMFDSEGAIKQEDVVLFFNFRPDRARQISLAFADQHFNHFKTPIRPVEFLCLSPYIDEECPRVPILFNREKIKHTLSEYLSTQGLKQFKIAETEKYAHVTYFFNGGQKQPFPGEEHFLIDSPKDVTTYDQKPEMSAPLVLDKLLKQLDDPSYSLFVVNFANPDMVGHTGNYPAAIKAMEYIDYCLEQLENKCAQNKISMLLTADHGNCDEMAYPDGSAQTSHSKAPVPFVLLHPDLKNQTLSILPENKAALKDVAPTILYLLGLEKPADFTGETIFS